MYTFNEFRTQEEMALLNFDRDGPAKNADLIYGRRETKVASATEQRIGDSGGRFERCVRNRIIKGSREGPLAGQSANRKLGVCVAESDCPVID
ncbi:hypothetical protein GWI33_000895 [Rhynchophorus ferrugineus]|uniref:Uncharacterized protein n=1 Tax=Rhynchophorus ferrugineus TaxID=354439 RepID=A0A834HQH6_RHYFE|nr:hypothetical protein GWI33_000895 [Rhynchophorus ferrugineus]